MKIYVPNHFKCDNSEEIFSFIKRNSFATLISSNAFITKIPLLIKQSEDQWMLEGHLARQNPHADYMRNQSELSIIFDGPHHYISPLWYSDPANQVPTWNYQTVLINGQVKVIDDVSWIKTNVMELADALESSSIWKEMVGPQLIENLSKAIIGIQINVTNWQAKMKQSQNRSPEDRQRVLKKLGLT